MERELAENVQKGLHSDQAFGFADGTGDQDVRSKKNPIILKSKAITKPLNTIGRNGRRKLCICCGSYRHLLRDCPDSWENKAKRETEMEEIGVMTTGFNAEIVRRLECELRSCCMIDATLEKTVCGREWIEEYIDMLNVFDKQKVQMIEKEVQAWDVEGGNTILKSGLHSSDNNCSCNVPHCKLT